MLDTTSTIKIKLAFLGSVVPDEPAYHNDAFSRAGNMCQLSLLSGLDSAGLTPSAVFSVVPVPSYPKNPKLFSKGESVQLYPRVQASLLPFLNITPFKQFYLGLAVWLKLLAWGWKQRSAKRIIFTFNVSVPPGFFTLMAARLTRSAIIAMVYDINVPGETVPRRPFWLLDFWLHRKCLPKHNGLVVITEAIAEDFAPNLPFLLVEGGINHSVITQYSHITSYSDRDPDFFTIVYAGALDEANGIREILDAFALLKGARYRFWIAGIGALEGLIRDVAASDSRIRYMGFVSFVEVMKLYASADVLVSMRLTQRLNTKYFFPSKTMECLASGVPVITTCPGNMTDEYGQFAYLLHEETPESLAALLTQVEGTPELERREKGAAAKRFILDNKTWDTQARRIRDFIFQIVG